MSPMRQRKPRLLAEIKNGDEMLHLYEGRPAHRPSTVGLDQILPAKRRYDTLRREHGPASIEPWDAQRCRKVVAAELSISVDTLRTWLTAANTYRPGTHRRVGGMGPKKKRGKLPP